MNWVLAGIISYVALQFAIGAWVSRQIKNDTDYINAGRRLGLATASFSVFATWFGAEAIIGTGGSVYSDGLVGGTVDPFGYAAALMIVGLTVAAPLWRRGYVTFADFFRDRYSPTVERLAILLILPGPIIWGAAQIRAFGQTLGTVSDLPLDAGILIATVVVIGYTVLGGLLADAYTDFLQGLAIIAGLVILLLAVAGQTGGIDAGLASVPPERIAYFSSTGSNPLALVEKWAIPIFGTMVSIELISRILGVRSAATATVACLIGGTMYLVVGLIPVFLGLVGPTLAPNLAEAEQIVPTLAKTYLPTGLYVIFIGAIISAILSTVDSVLLSGGAMISNNLIVPARPDLSARHRLAAARISVAILGIIAFVIALQSDSISDMVETASAIGSSGLIVVALFGLFTPIGRAPSAIAAMLTGAAVWGSSHVVDWTETPYVASVAAATAAYLAASLIPGTTAHSPGATPGKAA